MKLFEKQKALSVLSGRALVVKYTSEWTTYADKAPSLQKGNTSSCTSSLDVIGGECYVVCCPFCLLMFFNLTKTQVVSVFNFFRGKKKALRTSKGLILLVVCALYFWQ